ncbi:hypothetical protein [Mycobacterium simiae]|uniref:hypothetical protein n=1 Tax=Mycobacterium simiae TaxID=1784 RepID=UPI00165F59D2|nr:hypothetical protein [Mycobacterium simiae]
MLTDEETGQSLPAANSNSVGDEAAPAIVWERGRGFPEGALPKEQIAVQRVARR